jgi:hypothetical protein
MPVPQPTIRYGLGAGQRPAAVRRLMGVPGRYGRTASCEILVSWLRSGCGWYGSAGGARFVTIGPLGDDDLMDGLAGHAFVSYVREDSERVDRLQAVLDDAGVRVWRDTAHLWPGQDWRAEIRRAITADSLAFIACFSGSSALREVTYQSQELSLAVGQMRLRAPGRPWLIPVRFTPCDIPDLDLGEGRSLTSLQHVDLFDGSWERGIPRLLRAVLGVLHDRPANLHDLLERSGLEPALLTEFLEAAGAAAATRTRCSGALRGARSRPRPASCGNSRPAVTSSTTARTGNGCSA